MANSSCPSTSPAALRLARPKLPDSAMIMQLQLQLQHAPLFPRPPAARAHHHHHHQRRLLLAVSDHVAAKPVTVPVGRMRMRAATAMVSQEEAAATAVEEQQEEEVEEEQLQEEDGAAVQEEEQGGVLEGSSGGGEAEAEAAGITTKLYFGNLPYNCDSAQLAGIVQDYATPEMVEVSYTVTVFCLIKCLSELICSRHMLACA